MSDTTVETPVAIADRVRTAIEQDRVALPPLPELAIKLRELLQDEDRADAKAVAELVRNEPAVTTALLRFANSAAFGGLKQIGDLHQAIARLGLNRVGSLVTTLQMKGNFQAPDAVKREILGRLWDHAVAAAITARILAKRIDYDVEEAFLGGLLHDAGKLLVLKSVDVLQSEDPSLEVTRPVLDELMALLHAELGNHTLKSWNLPETLCTAALAHEEPVRDDQPALVTLVQAGDVIARKLGFHPNPDPELNLLDEPCLELLGIGDIEMAALMVDVEDEFAAVRDLF